MAKDVELNGGFEAFEQEVKTERKTPKGKEEQKYFTARHGVSTIEMLQNMAWLKQYVIDFKKVSQGDVIREGLELLAKKMKYDKLLEEHGDKLEAAKKDRLKNK